MQDKPAKFDGSQVWTEAMELLKGQREIVLTVAGFFMLLPSLCLYALRPFAPKGDTQATLVQEYVAWVAANLPWIALVGLFAALGRLAILILLLGPGRPSVGEALSAAVRLLILFVAMTILIRLMLFAGSLLFIVPALYLYGRTFVAEPAFVSDRARNPVAGIGRSFALTRGNGWRIFFVAFLIYLGGMIFRLAVGSVVGVVGALAGGNGLAVFLNAFVDASVEAGVALILLLMSVAAHRQLAQDGHVRRSALG
jgi:hypothetical protein